MASDGRKVPSTLPRVSWRSAARFRGYLSFTPRNIRSDRAVVRPARTQPSGHGWE
jgi:hypothetical protein